MYHVYVPYITFKMVIYVSS